MKILLVDDDQFLRDMYATKFSEIGNEVDVSGTSESALTKLRENKYDLVLLDMVMPGLSGVELLKMIKTDTTIDETICIMLSNQSEPEEKDSALKNGAIGYIVKAEFIPSEVVVEVERILASVKEKQ